MGPAQEVTISPSIRQSFKSAVLPSGYASPAMLPKQSFHSSLDFIHFIGAAQRHKLQDGQKSNNKMTNNHMSDNHMSDNLKKKKISVKDLVAIGIFSALILMAIVVGGLPFAINPFLTFYTPLGSALLAGPIFLLLLAKVHRLGALFTVGLLLGAVFFLTGMHWAMSLGYIIGALVADLSASLKSYKSFIVNALAYVVFCLSSCGSYLAYFISPAKWTSTMLSGGTPEGYIQSMNSVSSTSVLVVMLVGTVVAALLSALAGRRLLIRQFEKSGIIS
ncbi:MAG: MptD family putative ECF transporter S component [Deltaproteobacteria bacterium]|nr:MptD family putative ECF transporter S component [Deltaproteobacteria bacterium]